MNYLDKAKASIRNNVNLWIILWLLIILNIIMIFILSKGFHWWTVTLGAVFMLAGSGCLELVADSKDHLPQSQPDEWQKKIDAVMREVTPLCEEIFTRELNRIIQPVLENHRQDFSRGLASLWENGDNFAAQVQKGIEETNSALQMVGNLSDEKFNMVTQLRDNTNALLKLVEEVKLRREQDFEDLTECLNNRAEHLQHTLQREKEIFYEYIEKLMLEHIQNYGEEDIVEYLNIYKLGDQFQAVVNRTLEARISGFEDGLIEELENFAADIVGRMQKSAMQVMNISSSMEETMGKLINDYHGDGSVGKVLSKRLGDARVIITDLKEKSGEIMVTLAWQDIMIEKRWRDLEARLIAIKDHVLENVDDDVLEYIARVLGDEIPGLSSVSPSSETATIYKALVDAELVYQVYVNKDLTNIIQDGVYSLLLFIRPLESMVLRGIRLSEEGNRLRRVIKDEVRNGAYSEAFARLKQQVEQKRPALAPLLNGIYPKAYHSFCNNPYVKQKPDNLDHAGWMLFMLITEGSVEDERLCLLAGLLLTIHQLRNKYIQPLKNVPVPLEDDMDLDNLRYAAFKTVSLLLELEFKGLAKLKFRF
jgi:hypothetical protein